MNKLSSLLIIPPVLGVIAAVPGMANAGAPPNPPPVPVPVPYHGDVWYSYDYHDPSLGADPDWPINMVWAYRGDRDLVRSFLTTVGWHPHPAAVLSVNEKHLFGDNGQGWDWDKDTGYKGECVSIDEDTDREGHTRMYVPEDGSFGEGQNWSRSYYNLKWGFYILASTHYDFNDNPGIPFGLFVCDAGGEKEFGYSEQVESNLGSDASQAGFLVSGRAYPYVPGGTPPPPTTYRADDSWFGNEIYGTLDDKHYESDGYATMVYFKSTVCHVNNDFGVPQRVPCEEL